MSLVQKQLGSYKIGPLHPDLLQVLNQPNQVRGLSVSQKVKNYQENYAQLPCMHPGKLSINSAEL